MSHITFEKAQELVAKELGLPESKLKFVEYDISFPIPLPTWTICRGCQDPSYRSTTITMDRKITLFAHPAPGEIYKRRVIAGKCLYCGYGHWVWYGTECIVDPERSTA